MRKLVTVALLVVILPLTQASECKDSTGSGGGAVSNTGGRGFEDPNPGPQAPAPAADPGPQNDPGHAVLALTWVGERGGYVTINNSEERIPVPTPTKDRDGKYRGSWTRTIAVQKGQHYGFSWFPVTPGMFAQCTAHHNGTIADYQHVQTGTCAVSFVA